MPVIIVQSPGLFTTVQDLGRYGYGPLGVSPSGAADPIALRLGNLLVGNPEGAPALEMTLSGGTFTFPEGGMIALAGSAFAATLDGSSLPMWTSCLMRPGQTLKVAAAQFGARCYLCVRGGIAVKPFLGSASTHILSGLGGIEGRPLRKADVLNTGAAPAAAFDHPRSIPPEILSRFEPRSVLRATVAPQTDRFSAEARDTFYRSRYRVTEQSNRMGLRLDGESVEAPCSGQMITEGVSLGAVQIPAGGQPIILFVEQQTTGGYPKIANVISADLASVGQLRPGDQIQFELVSAETARSLIREQEALLRTLSLSFAGAGGDRR
jgi:antagonist of KipI